VWKLSKLEIRGFKSFADAAELDFPEGITAVVGPNGCGKSNISDAILWVLGEQSTRALRAQRMQDVIFQGTATRRAIGLAEVTLYLSNGAAADGFDPIAELAGDGKPHLPRQGGNGDKGNGAEGKGANGNGANGDGASGNGAGGNGHGPADGADAVVAAEGIAIDTSGSIEIDARQDGEPEPEADAASDPFDAASGTAGEETELKITRKLFRSGDSEYVLNGAKCRLRDIRERLAGTGLGARACFLIGQGKIDQILSASSMERRVPLEEAAGITLYRQRRHLTQLKLEATGQDLARIDDIYQEVGRQMRSLKRQAGRARKYKKLREQMRGLERAWLHGELSEARQKHSLFSAAVSGAHEAQEAAREKLETASGLLTEARNQLRASRVAEQERRQRLYQNQLEQERLKADAQRQDDRGTFAAERLVELERRATELEERLQEAASLQARREDVAEQSEVARRAAAQVVAEAEEELEAARRRLQLAMRPSDTVPADSGEPRQLSADLVVEEDDFAALSLALGALLDAKILPPDHLRPWLDESLDGNRNLRGLQETKPPIETPPPADDRIIGALRDKVSGRSEMASLVVHSLLRDTWLVSDATDAPELAREHLGHAFVDVTGSCWACGVEVRVRGRQARMLALEAAESVADDKKKAKPAVPSEQPEVTSPEELAARENRDRAATAGRAATAQAEAAKQELAVAEAAGRRLRAERERTIAEIKSLKEAADAALAKAEQSRARAAAVAGKGVELEADLNVADTDDRAGEAEVAGLESAQAQARDELEEARDVRSKCEVEVAEARVAGQHVEQQIRERLSMEPDVLMQEGPLAAVEEDAELEKGSRGKKKDDVVDVEALDARQLRSMIYELQDKIDKLGPVNLMAYDDFEEQETRHVDLGAQRKDLKDAAANLDEAISHIDKDCIQRFNDCFESVNGYLNRIFRQLFGGGKAGMKLEDPEDPLNTGIEIFAQPPGKKLQNIRLLSGGERTLVALSLLFAIFEYRPAAFCILDEADAALDEPNVDRFLRALHSFEGRTQFILITHNKRTMEIADLLYGVTMQESGVSQLVSVQLH